MTYENIGGTRIPGMKYPVLTRISEFYINLDFLEDYVELVVVDSTFAAIDDTAKEAAIVRSQIYVESKYYQGFQHWQDQNLQWPRHSVLDKNGQLVHSDQTPYDIFNAVAEGGYWEAKEPGILQPRQTDSDIYPVSSTRSKADVVESEKSFDTENKETVLSADRLTRLRQYLSPWLANQNQAFMHVART